MIQSQAQVVQRPQGFPEPTNSILKQFQEQVQAGQLDQALAGLKGYQPEGSTESSWKHYLTGVALFGAKKLEAGIEPLEECYEAIKQDVKAQTPDFRVAGLCLKKIGWFYRSKKDFHKAYAYHNVRYQYVLDHGSNLEVHDALISLDVDAFFLKDLYLSEKMLKESIPFAEKIQDEKARFMALGTSYNNLGGTSYGLKKFPQAESAIKMALDFWQKYEALVGVGEFKVAWAYFGVGDVYENWCQELKAQGQDFANKKMMAIEAYQQSLKLAQEQSMPEGDQQFIKERIGAVEAL